MCHQWSHFSTKDIPFRSQLDMKTWSNPMCKECLDRERYALRWTAVEM